MENYRRIHQDPDTEDETTTSNDPTQQIIKSSGNVKTYVSNLLNIIKVCLFIYPLFNLLKKTINEISNNQENKTITLHGKGTSINKTITVCEILKRRLSEQSVKLNQKTEIFNTLSKDLWAPLDAEKMDTLVVERHLPCIKIVLSLEE